MTSKLVTECQACGGPVSSVLNLGYSPPTCFMRKVGEPFTEETRYPLELLRCDSCSLVQLSCIVDPDIVFHPYYPYSSGNTRALREHFTELASEARRIIDCQPGDVVVDIGANDGTLLGNFPAFCQRIAVDPTDQVMKAPGTWVRQPFTQALAYQLREEFGPAKLITACNVLAHVEDIHDTLQGIRTLLADDGVLIAENHSLSSVVDGLQWDTVYHEHLRFYSPDTFTRLLERHGLYVWGQDDVPTHGGSFRSLACTDPALALDSPVRYEPDWERFGAEVKRTRRRLRRVIAQSGRWAPWGIGASARATTLINYCGLDVEDIACVCEVSTSDKIGHYIPGTRIPVVDEARLFEDPPLAVVLFSWHVADTLVPALRERGYRGGIYVPLPELRRV